MNKATSILLLEDDPALFQLIAEEFEIQGYRVTGCQSLAQAREALNSSTPDLLVTDLRLPDGNGMDLVSELLAQPTARHPGIIVITAFGSVRQAVAALKAGADDFLTKPLDLDHLLLSVERVMDNRKLRSELQQLRQLSEETGFHGIYGNSRVMQQLFEQIRVIARAQGPVLINGESGTGKELVARALHAESSRKDGLFLAVNCAGIPAELLESEFFGHASGVFTGARSSRSGLLQEADGGSLLLDEIAEMPLLLQAKLLRALQDGWIRPVGQEREVQVDVRIIAASHQDLKQAVDEGRFREDLYYRLETFAVNLPPLRDREEDIDYLAQRFLRQSALAQQKQVAGFSAAALNALRGYDFPGNVRELQNIVERALVFCDADRIEPEHLPQRVIQPAAGVAADHSLAETSAEEAGLLDGPVWPSLDELQKRYVRFILKETGGNKRRAAALLGIGRRTLYRWLDEENPASGG
jgi:DNA-binding NtrC family response regulator